MAPSLVDDPDRLGRLQRARRSAEYINHNMERLQELGVPYIVLADKEVLGVGDTPDDAWEDAGLSEEETDNAILVRVPREDETFLF